jgi:hypothetical protein
MVYEMKFEVDEPQFTQREVLGVIDLPATSLNTWLKQGRGKNGTALLEPFEFVRDFRDDDQRFKGQIEGKDTWDKVRTFKVFHHDPAARRMRLYSVLDTLCLAGIKAVLDANIEIRFASQLPGLLCHWLSDRHLWNLHRHSISEEPIILYVDDGQLMRLVPPTPMRALTADVTDPKEKRALEANSQALVGQDPHRVEIRDLTKAMRDAQLTSVTMIDWPAVEERVIDGLKRIIGVRGHRDWERETE